ncbi:hypothetical protein CEXT_349911 [Caerostris extrusa]|uniref:Uncharacterized protein n=1 Tax=Caerostris extrusa TaxID=172846 RepID=A0AAV4MTQ8_CAEEX|nr:hypothetical protein CEXT_349911 [Caerostris extrusa]
MDDTFVLNSNWILRQTDLFVADLGYLRLRFVIAARNGLDLDCASKYRVLRNGRVYHEIRYQVGTGYPFSSSFCDWMRIGAQLRVFKVVSLDFFKEDTGMVKVEFSMGRIAGESIGSLYCCKGVLN